MSIVAHITYCFISFCFSFSMSIIQLFMLNISIYVSLILFHLHFNFLYLRFSSSYSLFFSFFGFFFSYFHSSHRMRILNRACSIFIQIRLGFDNSNTIFNNIKSNHISTPITKYNNYNNNSRQYEY